MVFFSFLCTKLGNYACKKPLVFAKTTVVQPDRPGMGTGTTVLERGVIQWETGFEVDHLAGLHLLTLPTTLFRFGVDKRAELRLEFGVTYLVHPRVQLDLYAGFNCFHSEQILRSPQNDSFVGFGLA